MIRTFDLDTVYHTKAGVVTAKLYYIVLSQAEEVPMREWDYIKRRQQLHATLKHMNPVMYSHYGRSIPPTGWGGDAWVTLFLGDRAIGCYMVSAPAHRPVYGELLGGYEVRNEAVLKEFRGLGVGSHALFPSIGDAVRAMEAVRAEDKYPPRGTTVGVAVDAGLGSTGGTVDFLKTKCGFTAEPAHWKGVFIGDSRYSGVGSWWAFCFAATEEGIPQGTCNVAYRSREPTREILLYKRFI
jgi:hypothetical protein